MNRDALVVGINHYPFLKNSPTDKGQHLTTAAADAEEIAQRLEKYGHFGVRRLPETSIESQLQVNPAATVTAIELERAIASYLGHRTLFL